MCRYHLSTRVSGGGPLLAAPGLNVKAGPVDNRKLEIRPDVLVYTSDPLVRDLEVIGTVAAELLVRSSLGHTDFFARLCDVHPSGRSVNVCDAILRVAPGGPGPEADGTLRLRIELWPTAHRFKRNHRLRLQVSSGAHPRYARNTGSGESLATATKLVRANQEVFHDTADPGRYLEAYIVGSWVEHLRQHERVSVAEKELQERVHSFLVSDAPPVVSHFVAGAPSELGSSGKSRNSG